MDFEPYEGYFWQGEKVRLRPMQIEDATQKLREYTDSEARAWLQLGIELPPVSLEKYTEQIKPYCNFQDTVQNTLFSIDTLAGEYVGWINLHSQNFRRGTFGFGISIFREYRKNGYAEEAVRILLRYGFFELRMQKCNSACIDINQGSIRLHQKLGFKQEGRIRRNIYLNGELHDDLMWGLLKEEFEDLEKQRSR
jgi:RimJ/RimL family protein N-acetyltransferase